MIAEVVVEGGARARGRAHGAQRSEQIRAFLGDDLCRLGRLMDARPSLDALRPTLAAYHHAIEGQLPAVVAELHGLAEGAGISYEEALLLQLRREIMGYRRVPSRGDCTTFARVDGSDAVLAQTVDLQGHLEREAYVLRYAEAGADGRELLLLTFTGLLGYLGMNSHGLAIGLNLVLGGEWRPGIPGYLAIRQLLETARSVEECRALLPRLDLASSRSLTLCDLRHAATVEILDNELRWLEGSTVVHTNHFLHPDFVARDQINVFARNGSVARLGACTSALAEPSADEFTILDRAPICVPRDDDPRREATVARVVMKPRRLELQVKQGAERSSTAQSFGMRARA